MARKLSLSPVVDPRSALAGFAQIQTGAGAFTKALGGMESKGHSSFRGLAGAMGASGLPGQFGELTGLVGGLGGAFDSMGERGKASFGKVAMGAGIGLAAIGAIGLAAAKPAEDATARLKTAIANAGGDIDTLKKPINDLERRMQVFGHTTADTDNALATLTIATKDPAKALQLMSTVSLMAANGHKSLAESALDEARIYGGNTRMLKQYGINVKDTTALGAAAVRAKKDQAAADADLLRKQQALADLQARLGASTGAGTASGAKAVAAARAEEARAAERLQAVQQRLTAAPPTTAAGRLSAQQQLRAAQESLASATARVSAAEAGQARGAGLSIAQQQELRRATQAVTDAKARASAADALGAQTAADLAKGTLSADQANAMINQRLKGVDAAMAKTFGGRMREAKAMVEDFAAAWGERFGKGLILAGPALAGVGGLIESGVIGKVGRATAAVAKFGPQFAAGLAGVGKGASSAARLGGAVASGAKGLAGMGASALKAGLQVASAGATAIIPWLPFIAAAALVAGAAYLIYRNWGTIEKFFKGIWGGIEGGAQAAWHAVQDFATGLPHRLMGMLTAAGGWLVGVGRRIVGGLMLGFEYLTPTGLVLKFHDKIINAAAGAGSWLLDAGKGLLRGLKDGAVWVWDNEVKAALNVKDWIVGAFTGAGGWLLDVGKDVLKGLAAGLLAAAKATVGHIPIIGGRIVKEMKDALGVKSPSTVFAAIGREIPAGLALGINGNKAAVSAALASLPLGVASGAAGGSNRPFYPAPAQPGPSVAHYHDSPITIQRATIVASDPSQLRKGLEAETARANFSGAGVGAGGSLVGVHQ